MLKANFHTHTFRCRHAEGSEREYIEEGIKSGLKTLGFSDHTPYFFDKGYVSNDKMLPSELEGYVQTINDLKKEYKSDIDIYLGLETEYYPKHFEELIRFIEPYGIEYMILGQHYTNNEYDGVYAFTKKHTEGNFITYVNQVITAINTGYFSYVAHPDVFYYPPETEVFSKNMEKICLAAKEKGIPLEFNLSGFITGHWYPSKEFLQVAKNVGNEIIFGIDAHQKFAFNIAQSNYERAENLVKEYGLKITDKIKLLDGRTV